MAPARWHPRYSGRAMITLRPFVRAAAGLALGLASAACASEPLVDSQVFEASGVSFSDDLSEVKQVETTKRFTVVIHGDLEVGLVTDVTWTEVPDDFDGSFSARVFSDDPLGSNPDATIAGLSSTAWMAGETDHIETSSPTIFCDEAPCEVELTLAMRWTSVSGAARGGARWRLRLIPRGELANDPEFWVSIREDEGSAP